MSRELQHATDDYAALEQATTEWFFRKDRGLTEAEESELAAWLAADARRAVILAEIQETWNETLKVKDRVMVEKSGKIAPAIPAHSAFLRFGWYASSLAAAAALAIGYFSWWQPAHFTEQMVTAVGDIRHWELPDGSVIDLNTDSAVNVAYSFGERRIELVRGEAHFAVAKNKERPFIVSADKVSVRAVGTAFNVRLRADSVDVLVTEGKVKVAEIPERTALTSLAQSASLSGDLFLEAGHRVSVPLVAVSQSQEVAKAPPVETLAAPAIEQSMAWQKRRVEFVDATLSDMVAEFNRYNRHQLVIDDPKLAQMRFGGAFPADDYDSFVQVLETTFGVKATRRGDSTVLRLDR